MVKAAAPTLALRTSRRENRVAGDACGIGLVVFMVVFLVGVGHGA
jgi:hypothetical protein